MTRCFTFTILKLIRDPQNCGLLRWPITEAAVAILGTSRPPPRKMCCPFLLGGRNFRAKVSKIWGIRHVTFVPVFKVPHFFLSISLHILISTYKEIKNLCCAHNTHMSPLSFVLCTLRNRGPVALNFPFSLLHSIVFLVVSPQKWNFCHWGSGEIARMGQVTKQTPNWRCVWAWQVSEPY